LRSPSFLKLLQEYDMNQITVTTPKQTSTTQRWKIQLYTKSEIPLNTKIEFSRRHQKLRGELGAVVMDICRQYRLAPMRLMHYGTTEAISQKILALANRSLTQARDIFDLYHLLHIAEKPTTLPKKNILEKASEAVYSIHFEDYRSQVINFLESDKQKEFNNKDYWHLITNTVYHYLNEAKK